MEGIFITGTDTGVGKTLVSAGLLTLLQGSSFKAAYWKPIQTGTIVGTDLDEVKRLTQLPGDSYFDSLYAFADPISPHLAASKWGKDINVAEIVTKAQEYTQHKFLLVEGAGGLLVPINETELQVDIIQKLGLPVLVVAEDRVGGINHALLTLRVAEQAGIKIMGIILTRSRNTLGNAESIVHFGHVPILAELAPVDDPKMLVSQVGFHSGLREFFKLPPLPA